MCMPTVCDCICVPGIYLDEENNTSYPFAASAAPQGKAEPAVLNFGLGF